MDNAANQLPDTVIIPPAITAKILQLQSNKPILVRDKLGRIIRATAQETNKNGTAGRPAFDEDYIVDKLREAFLMGCTDREACLYAGISKDWLYNYQHDHPEFVEQKEDWKDNPKLQARRNLYNAITGFGDVDSSQWFLERKAKDEFSRRQELTGADGEAIEMTLDKLENNKTNYDAIADKARAAMDSAGQAERQVVATDTSIQDQG